MNKYNKLSEELQDRIREDREKHVVNPYAFKDEDIVRRNPNWDRANLWRPAFVRDTQKIMNVPYYNRYADKTQVFSFYKNDDISRRSSHVQLVSRIARSIGGVLNLNNDLIEAIALGHDIGHTPFGHEGERQLNALYHGRTGKYFNHNVHSVRVLDKMIHMNLSLQTLDGILCHNGEMEQQEYRPCRMTEFEEFDKKYEACCLVSNKIKSLTPCTLEGCVMRICDIIAYLGKDRQDAVKLGLIEDDSSFSGGVLGNSNAQIINNLTVNIIENSYGKPFISMDKEYFDMLVMAKDDNARNIYKNSDVNNMYTQSVKPMLEQVYDKLLEDARAHDKNSVLYRHHVSFVNNLISFTYDKDDYVYEETEPNQIVVDYIASMTDDYFVDLYAYLFPKSSLRVKYIGYFDNEPSV